MNSEVISSGAQAQHNADGAGSFRTPDNVELVVIDGAGPVVGRDYIEPEHGDLAWFVNRFAAALEAAIGCGPGQQAAVHDAWPIEEDAADAHAFAAGVAEQPSPKPIPCA